MKVIQKTSRLLKLKQTNWMPWYGHLLLWPTATILLLMTFAGQSSMLTCSRSSGQCQLNHDRSNIVNKSIPIDAVSKFDVIATDNTSESPDAQVVMITKEGEFNVGLSGDWEDRDEAAGKLAWFFEDQNSQFIELQESSKTGYTYAGLTGIGMVALALLFRKNAQVSFDRDTDRCTVQLSRFFGLLKGRRETCELPHIKSVELSGSLKVADDRILVQQSSGASFFLTDYATKDPRNELAAVNQIKDFLNLLGHPKQHQPVAEIPEMEIQDKFSAEKGWVEEPSVVTESYTSEFYSSSSEYSTTAESNPTESGSNSSSSDGSFNSSDY
jgi:hypothetical protein